MAKTSEKGLNLQEPSEVPAFAVQDENITRFCSANWRGIPACLRLHGASSEWIESCSGEAL